MSIDAPLVISVHGIRTRGAWQKDLDGMLSDHGFRVRAYDYGFFGLPKFLNPVSRRRMIDQFCDYYQALHNEVNARAGGRAAWPPTVIAHSFGTYIVGYCMLKYKDVKFDQVLLCGSILPRDFSWSTLIGRGQVHHVRNECGARDRWTRLAGRVVRDAGDSGSRGFDFESTSVEQEHFDHHAHSDFFQRNHVEHQWIPFLQRKHHRFRILHGREIGDRDQYRDKLNASHEIDLACFGGIPGYSDVDLPRGLSLSWIDINPDVYTFLLDDGEGSVKGYVNAMPVDDDAFLGIKAGRLSDNEIQAKDVLPFRGRRNLKLYLMSIAIDPEARSTSGGLFQEGLEKLLYGLTDKLIAYGNAQGVTVGEIAGVGWTPQGRRLCRLLGMSEVASDRAGNPVFWVDLRSPSIRGNKSVFPGLRALVTAYDKVVEH